VLNEPAKQEGRIILFIEELQTMIGAPPGCVGQDEGSSLTEAVRRQPEMRVSGHRRLEPGRAAFTQIHDKSSG
jgi:ATP-dependent Clp protease ATP-binding subunit ClpA